MGNMTLHAEGTPVCSFQSSAKVPIESLKAYFAPTQSGSGDPSPSNVRPISGWTGLSVMQSGKNLYDVTDITYGKWVSTNGYVNNVAYGCISSNKIPIKAGSTINVTVFGDTLYSKSIVLYDLDGTFSLRAHNTNTTTLSYTVSKNYLFALQIANGTNTQVPITEQYIKDAKIMITIGSVPIEYEPYCGETIPVTFPGIGKNLFSGEIEQGGIASADGKNTGSSSRVRTKDYLFLKGGKTYTISAAGLEYITLFRYNLNKEYVGAGSFFTSMPYTINPAEDYYIRLTFRKSSNNENITPADISNIQIEEGSSATTYEAFNNTIYGGYVDLAKGELVQTIGFYQTTWGNWSTDYNGNTILGSYERRVFASPIKFKPSSVIRADGVHYCSIAKDYEATADWNIDKLSYNLGNNLIYLKLPINTSDGTIIQFSAPLATPITYPLTPTLISALRGQNHILSSATDKVEVDYDLHETKEIAAAKRRIAANTPHIETVTNSVATFNTDMRAPLKGAKFYFSPIQEGNGEPSPSNVRAISGWMGLKLYQSHKNIIANDIEYVENEAINNSNNIVSNVAYRYNPNFIVVKPNTTYTCKMYKEATYPCGFTVPLYDINKDFIIRGIPIASNDAPSVGWYTGSFTTTSDTKYIRFSIPTLSSYIQIEEGQIATAYEEPSSSLISWQSSQGIIYGGYVDLVNGEVVATWEYQTSTWGQLEKYGSPHETTNYQYGFLYFNNPIIRSGYGATTANTMCNVGVLAWRTTAFASPHYYTALNNNAYCMVVVLDSDTDSNTVIQGAAELITPIHYPFTPMILKTLRGTNNIWSNTNGNTEIKYWTH